MIEDYLQQHAGRDRLGLAKRIAIVALEQLRRHGGLPEQWVENAISKAEQKTRMDPNTFKKTASNARAIVEFGTVDSRPLVEKGREAASFSDLESLVERVDTKLASDTRTYVNGGTKGGRPPEHLFNTLKAVELLVEQARVGNRTAQVELELVVQATKAL